MSASILRKFRDNHKCCEDRRHGTDRRGILHDVHDLVYVQLGVVKSHVIHCVRDEPKGRSPDDVLAKKDASSKRALGQGVPDDPADRDPHLDTRLGHLFVLL